MDHRRLFLGRRRFLRGAGGVVVGLPLLDAFRPRTGRAAARHAFSFFFKQGNGFAKAEPAYREPEMFLPSRPGPLTTAGLGADGGRALSELKDHASRLIVVAGANFAHGAPCGHFRGCAQVLTAAALSPPTPFGGRNQALPLSESIDSRIARELTPGREPLVVHAERGSPRPISWRGPKEPRSSQGNPWTVYQNLVGLASGQGDPTLADRIRARHRAVNDLVREEMTALLRRTDLSAEDRRRLDLHFSSIRDVEVKLSSRLAPETVQRLQAVDGKHRLNDRIPDVVRLHMDLIAWAFASGAYATAVLITGGDVTYDVDGYNLNGIVPSFHQISHRILSDGADGPALPDAQKIHHKIDRIHARYFKYFLDRLAAYTLPDGGTLLDRSVAVWTNENATGWHRTDNVPFVVAGSAGGYLKTGQYIDLGGRSHNRLLSTLLNAALGRSKDNLIDDFGDPALSRGVVREMLA